VTTFDSEEERILELARRGLAPAPGDAERVLRATRLALAALPLAASPANMPARAARGDALFRAPNWLRQLFGGIGIAAVSGSAGYYAGTRSRARVEGEPSIAASRTQATTSMPMTNALDRKATATEPNEAPPAPAERGPTEVRVSRLGSSQNAASRAPAAPLAPASIEEEVRALRRVERAEREGNPRLALALLDELDQKASPGPLAEERAAASVVARCALGYGSSVALAGDFEQRFPASFYAKRVAQACAADAAAAPAEPSETEPHVPPTDLHGR
jgi:hypothetical protein